MSKSINVNPGQYKVAGRERPGKEIPHPERPKRTAPTAAARSKPTTQRKSSSRSR